ncbi:hypothetical protein TOPH_01962 [Tolypocladium ophioglossoides CBS 100239]|uniref:Insecticidal crystal toxin domain-containing protein n=1 Tax=Tolypocladium ophioglossoides (strain CBS 100239) TaxID=1163406 RepID=A0A0L0NJ71_TOLOC|nr:hypothetical protein TOPH_01962 [Tolypocladium ophioglossoides CBS 100239]
MSNQTWDYGDLRVTLTSTYVWNWDDGGSGAKKSIMIWTLEAQGDLRPLGSVGIGSRFYELGGQRDSLLVGNNPNSTSSRPAVASPTGWTQLLSTIWCLRDDLVKDATFEEYDIWNDHGSDGDWDISCWRVVPQPMGTDGSEHIPILADTFRYNGTYDRPDLSLAVVPILDLPKEFDRFKSPLPQVTPTTIPSKGDIFDQIEQCRATLPFIAFFDPTTRRALDSIENPFCTIIRSIAWGVEGVWVNDADGEFDRTETIKYGVSKDFGVEITAEAGIKALSFSVSLNYQFTYSTSSTYTKYSEKQVDEKFTVPAHAATVLFSKHVWIKGMRSDGSELSRIGISANDDVRFGGCDLPH